MFLSLTLGEFGCLYAIDGLVDSLQRHNLRLILLVAPLQRSGEMIVERLIALQLILLHEFPALFGHKVCID